MISTDISDIPPNAAIVIDRRGYIVGWNEGAEAVLGFPEKEVVGRACHHVLCGHDPEGHLVCHPWCSLSPEKGGEYPDEDLVLYPHSAARDVIEVTLSVFRVEVTDATRGWVVHLITSARPLSTSARGPWRNERAWGPGRRQPRPKPPDIADN